MSELLVIGAGGHGRVVADAALSSGVWQAVAFVDERREGVDTLGFPLVGGPADLPQLARRYRQAIVAIGDATTRLRLMEECRQLAFELPVVVHRSAVISSYASVAAGCTVLAQAAINPGASLGFGCIVNSAATIDHDCRLAAGVHVAPGAHLAGNVTVGDRTWIGIGSCVKQGVVIGADVMIGSGAAVVANIAAGLIVMGVPARPRQTQS